MRELHARKSVRLKGYDYSNAGWYFITMCVKDRYELLGCVGANCVHPELSDVGVVVEREMQTLSNTYDGVVIDKHIVMPNHVHMILGITSQGRTQPDGRTQFAPTISRVIKQFKGSITKQLGYSIWQKSFHDHIIRNEADYMRIWQYIDDNPATWQEDCYFPK